MIYRSECSIVRLFDVLQTYSFKFCNIIKSFGIKQKCKAYDDHPCFYWKYNVFEYILAQNYVDSVKDYNHNIDVINTFVFIGDSPFEYMAANKLRIKSENKNLFIDRIKLKYKPEINELINEHQYLHSKCSSFEHHSFAVKCAFDVDYVKEIERVLINTNETKTEERYEF